MKLTVATCRKLGLPEYSSVGSTCEIELELTDAADDQAVVDTVRRLQSLCDQAVAEHLARHIAPDVPPAPAEKPRHEWPSAKDGPGPAPEPERRPPSNMTAAGRLENGVKPNGFNRPGNGGGIGAPRTGKALFAWLKETEQKKQIALLKYVNQWARLQEFPGRMVDWDADQVALAYAEVTRKLTAVERVYSESEAN